MFDFLFLGVGWCGVGGSFLCLLLFEVKNGMYWYGSVVRKLHLYLQKTSNPKPLSVENYVDLGDIS